jgi:hypothetical protein
MVNPNYQGQLHAAIVLMGENTYGLRDAESARALADILSNERSFMERSYFSFDLQQIFHGINSAAITFLLKEVTRFNKGEPVPDSLDHLLE